MAVAGLKNHSNTPSPPLPPPPRSTPPQPPSHRAHVSAQCKDHILLLLAFAFCTRGRWASCSMQQPSDHLAHAAYYAASHAPEHASQAAAHNTMPPRPPLQQGSMSSQSSTASQPVSADTRYASYTSAHTGEPEYTPPSSFSPLPSSQPFVSHPAARDVTPQPPSGSPAAMSDWRPKQRESGASSPSSASGNSGSPTHGSKRTASGAMKMPEVAPSSYYAKPRVGGGFHSRNTSVASNGSSVGEVSRPPLHRPCPSKFKNRVMLTIYSFYSYPPSSRRVSRTQWPRYKTAGTAAPPQRETHSCRLYLLLLQTWPCTLRRRQWLAQTAARES